MTPGIFNLWIYRGDTYFWKFDLWHDLVRKYPVNLLGATAKMEIRDESGGRLRATCHCYIVEPNTVVATLDARQSEDLTESEGVWDLQINSIGIISTPVRGTVTVEGDVTDSRATVQTTSRATGLVPFPKRGVRAA